MHPPVKSSTDTSITTTCLPAQWTVNLAVLAFGPQAFRAERVKAQQDARVAVVVFAQEAQQWVATGRGGGRTVAGSSVRRVRHHRLRHSQ